ncbi:MAG: tRNA lysidine(34) synthetase TilS [Paludibacteraceae bacterium]|nr:tRNA lysidine(34) synthetase TilS [Paludibacteraceae bacterium]
MLLNTVEEYIRRHELVQSDERVLVALSGGADSVTLLHILVSLGYSCEAAHCNFHLRGEESQRDMAFVEDLCQKMSIKCHIKHFRTTDYARQHGVSIEMAARELRYKWFEELRQQTQCDRIAVAHHQNDQAETLLMNIARGSGLKGMGGIRPKNGYIIRPLLCVTRHQIEEYIAANGLRYVTDSTNSDTTIKRNAWRALLSNLTEQEIHHFADSAELMQQYYILLCNLLRGDTISSEASTVLLYELLSPLGFNASQVSNIKNSLSESGRRFVTTDFTATTNHGRLSIEHNKPAENNTDTPELKYYIVRKNRQKKDNESFPSSKEHTAFFDADSLPPHLALRYWRNGDRFYPLTNNTRQYKRKLQDYFSDLKLSINEKTKILVVCDADEPSTIVWIVGYRQDNRFKVTSNTTQIAELTINVRPQHCGS